MFSAFFADKDDPVLIENGPYKPFTLSHISVTLFAFVFVYLIIRYLKQKQHHTRFLWVFSAYVLLVLLNVLRFIWDIGVGHFDVKEDLPLQLCGIQMFTLPFALFSRGKIGDYTREFAYSYGTIGFLLALMFPLDTLYDYPVFHFRTMQSMLYHADMGFIVLMLPYFDYKPDIKNVYKSYAVLLICVLFTGIINLFIGSNYLYTAALPITFKLLRWPFYMPFLLAFALIVGRLPYYAYNFFQKLSLDKPTGPSGNLTHFKSGKSI